MDDVLKVEVVALRSVLLAMVEALALNPETRVVARQVIHTASGVARNLQAEAGISKAHGNAVIAAVDGILSLGKDAIKAADERAMAGTGR